MSFFSKLFGKSNKDYAIYEIKAESAAALQQNRNMVDGELVAVIMAALSTMLSDKNDLQIKSIRRIGRTSPVWNLAGRDEYIATRL
ncbi:MAG TPA: hypothetical protein DD738_09805 [Ruminiclostridium sp.]|jgi:hypothetical protein|nr:hypothetical protein [Ruminiclostridium sp.]